MLKHLRRSAPHTLTVSQSRALVELILTQNMLPFWYPQVLDEVNGGYRLNHDANGQWSGATDKALVAQARTTWFFAHLSQTPYGRVEHLQAAQQGYAFLQNCLWDNEFGGFYWKVDATGKTVVDATKHLYGQAFALYALSEYAIVSGDRTAAALADTLFDCLERFAYDAEFGGYREWLQRDWQAVPSERWNDLGVTAQVKLMNTHLHLLEAITVYARLSQRSIAQQRLTELIIILSNTIVRKPLGACTDQHQPNWTPLHYPPPDQHYPSWFWQTNRSIPRTVPLPQQNNQQRSSYGHDLENIWLLGQACQQAQLSHYLFLDLYHTLFHYAQRYGYDTDRGGFYESGRYSTRADRRTKIWWVQAEALVASLWLYQMSQEPCYWDCFCQTLGWIMHYQTDWQHGDWHAEICPNGKPAGHKATNWKTPYHNGRAMIMSLELLQRLGGNAG